MRGGEYVDEVDKARNIHKAEVVWRTSTGMGLRILGQLEDAAARETLFRKFRRG